jgi:hypothetical protein
MLGAVLAAWLGAVLAAADGAVVALLLLHAAATIATTPTSEAILLIFTVRYSSKCLP